MQTKQSIKIENTGVSINQNGNSITLDRNTSLEDYKPTITRNSSWTGILNKGDSVDLNMFKFIFLRARKISDNSLDKNISSNITNIENYCSPAHNSLVNACGCSSNGDNNDTLLEFEMNSYTNYTLNSKVLNFISDEVLDCSRGNAMPSIAVGWDGCELLDGGSCNTDPLENVISFQGATGGNCSSEDNITVSGIYNYIFTGVLENYGLVIKNNSADCQYACKNDYYAFVKNDNEKVLVIFENIIGKWLVIRLDEKISDIIENEKFFNITEVIELSDYNKSVNFNNSGILLPTNNQDDVNYFKNSGDINILDNTNNIKINNLLVLESDRFDGKIVSKMDDIKLSINLSF